MKHRPLKQTAAIIGITALCFPITAHAQSSDLGSLFSSNPFGSSSSGSHHAPVTPEPPLREGWQLVHEENFNTPLDMDKFAWQVDPHGDNSPWHVDEFDDDGEFFTINGDDYFRDALGSFNLLRKQARIGEGGWLTAEFAARDYAKDGVPENPPQLITENGEARLEVPQDGGLILTSTNPLPDQYRVEYELKTLDFGGMRNGSWEYDGKKNGHTPPTDTECKTNFPWKRQALEDDGKDKTDPCGETWGDTTTENGYYLLSIMDYAHPAPHNNIFIHSHRKVGMDVYSVDAPWNRSYKVCNPADGTIKPYTEGNGNGVNEIFFDGSKWRDPGFAYNEFVMPTECGVQYGDTKGSTIVSAVELQPELMPNETYTFAIERTATGYVQEMSGNFRHVGQQTYRYERPFVGEDGRPIWHYNQTPEAYDGQFNSTLTFEGPYGSFEKEMWPAGSAYPDNFVIGIPHINYYAGSATVDNIRFFTPDN